MRQVPASSGAPDTPWKTDAAVPDGIIIQADQAAPDVPADQSRRDVIGDTARDVAPEVNLLGKDAGQSEAGNANMAEAGALVPPRITPACVAPLPTGFCLAGDSGDYIAAGTNIAVPGDTAVALYRSNSTHVRFTLSANASQWYAEFEANPGVRLGLTGGTTLRDGSTSRPWLRDFPS